MAISIKDIAEVVGFEIDESKTTVDEIKTHLDEKFIARANLLKDKKAVDTVFGKTVGALRTKFKGFGFEQKDIEDKSVEELVGLLETKHSEEVKKLQEKSNVGNDKKLNDLMAEMAEKDKSIGSYKTALQEKQEHIDKITGEFNGNLKSYKVNHKLGEVKSKIPFIEDYGRKEVLQSGFEQILSKKYKFNTNEKDELEVTAADGTPIKHPKKAGEFMKPDEVIMMEAEAQGLIKKNNAGTERKTFVIKTSDGTGSEVKSKVHPNAQKAAQKVA